MNYSETLNYLFNRLPMFHRVGQAAYKADLTNTIELCRLLGNPENRFPSVHVAGTNGKGSVSHMLASIMQEKGVKTGLYTSPHLKDFRERIRINGEMIPEEKVITFVEDHKSEFERIGLSFFEMTVGMAFDYFRKEKVDIAIIEVGLGGRLDSTNVITPLVSVITNISLDHMQFLGNSPESIAKEKAGIIKPRIPVVIGETQPETEKIFTSSVSDQKLIMFADKSYSVGKSSLEIDNGSHIRKMDILHDEKPFLTEVKLPLGGQYQEKNILTVLATCSFLPETFRPDNQEIRKGLENTIINTGLMGRWQIISHSPLTICDTGHNEAGLREVLEQIKVTPHNKLHFVFGVVNDKKIEVILGMLPRDAAYYFCKADIPRGLDAVILKEKANAIGLKGEAYGSVSLALEAARRNAKEGDLIFIGGSTFVVAEVL